jgi:hypothetical protein
MYDIIGDVHGHYTLLKKLLKFLGYEKNSAGYAHPERKAVFVGDFVNRGPEIRQTIRLIRNMTDSGSAFAILGNHEVNTILYHLKTPDKIPLLQIVSKRSLSVSQTIQEFRNFPEEWKDYRKWLRTLPFYLDFGDIRIVHACWKDENISLLKENLPDRKIPKSVFRDLVLNSKSPLSQAILQTTRGIYHMLPHDLALYDDHRRLHHFYRMKWWEDPSGKTFQENSFESKFRLPGYTIPPEIAPVGSDYPEEAPPVFFGHYCLGNGPYPIRKNLCCVDGCVIMSKKLAAYRWNGEKELIPENMVFVR